MSTFRNPVGPQSANVYWRRRLFVGGGLLLVVIIILLIVFSPKGGDADNTADEKTPTAPVSSAAPIDDADPSACNPETITLEAVTDADSYQAGVQPLISMKITNLGTNACTINAGTDAQVYTITSGPDAIWNSVDCQTAPVENPITIEPGVDNAMSTTPFAWDRTRSAADTCDTQRPQVAAGGGTYRLNVSLGDITSEEDKAFLLY